MNALLADKVALAKLAPPNPEDGRRMGDRIAGIQAFRDQVGGEKLIEGWVEGPCALGADLRGLHNLMMDFYEDRHSFMTCLGNASRSASPLRARRRRPARTGWAWGCRSLAHWA